MNCQYCDRASVGSIQLRIGEEHPDHDQKDTSKMQVIALCTVHMNELKAFLARLALGLYVAPYKQHEGS